MQRPFYLRQGAGRGRLLALLRRVMIRASKADLWMLPRCREKVTGTRPRLLSALCPEAHALQSPQTPAVS